jgi:hypothetical protein
MTPEQQLIGSVVDAPSDTNRSRSARMTETPELKKLADTVVLAMQSMSDERRVVYMIEMANVFAERTVASIEQPEWDEATRRHHLLHYASLFGEAVSKRLDGMKASGGASGRA